MDREEVKLFIIVSEDRSFLSHRLSLALSAIDAGFDVTVITRLKEFERILDMIVPKYGKPIINLEGSGEPTMAKDLDLYVAAVNSRGLKCYMYCNGARLQGDFMKKVIDAKIDFIRFSVIGYNRDLYKKWMNIDNFNLIINNISEA